MTWGKPREIRKTYGFPVYKWWVFHIYLSLLEAKPAILRRHYGILMGYTKWFRAFDLKMGHAPKMAFWLGMWWRTTVLFRFFSQPWVDSFIFHWRLAISVIIDWMQHPLFSIMWAKQCHKPFPGHHHFYSWHVYMHVYHSQILIYGWFMILFYPQFYRKNSIKTWTFEAEFQKRGKS